MIRNISTIFIIQAFSALMGFGLNLTLVKGLGVDSFGALSLFLSTALVLSALSKLGFNVFLTKEISFFLSREQTEKIYPLIKFAFLTTTSAACLISLAGLVGGYGETEHWFYLFFAILMLTYVSQLEGILRARKKVVIAIVPYQIIRPALFGVGLGCLWAFSYFSLEAVLSLYCISLLIATTWSAYHAVRLFPKIDYRRDEKVEAGWMWQSLPFTLISGSNVIQKNADIIMIGFLLDLKSAGIYTVCSRIASLLSFGLVAVNAVTSPYIARGVAANDNHRLKEIISLNAKVLFAYGLACLFGVLLFGKFILNLFGEEFVVGFLPLVVLVVAQFINCSCGPVGSLLSMSGNQNFSSKVMFFAAIINVALNFLIIPFYGIIGASVSTGLSIILWNLCLVYFSISKLKLNPTVLGHLSRSRT